MSIVIATAFEHSAIIGSDGRAICSTDNSIVTENYNKTIKLCNNVIMGFTGETIICENVVSYLKTLSISTVEDTSYHIKELLESLNLSESRRCAFTVAGTTTLGHMELHSIGTKNHLQIKRDIPISNSLAYSILSPDDVDGERIFVQNVYALGIQNIKEAIRLSICEAARANFSINTNCHFQEILL